MEDTTPTQFFVHDADGVIVASGIVPAHALSVQPVGPGETLVVGEAYPDQHYVENGELREFTPEERQRRASTPDYPARWNARSRQWEDTSTEQQQRQRAMTRIIVSAEASEFGTFTHAGKTFSASLEARARINLVNGYVALANTLPVNWPGYWPATDGDIHPIVNRADWAAFYASLVAHSLGIQSRAQALRAQAASAPREQVKDVKW